MLERLTLALVASALLADGCPFSPDPVEPETCVRAAAAADRPRFMVVAHPYDDAGAKANTWEVLTLSESGALNRTGELFEMGRATEGEVAFTPDGQVGIAVQEGGGLGVFTLSDAGFPEVIQADYHGDFYAGQVVMSPEGSRAWVLDPNWVENGGGIYEIGIACDGTVFDRGLVMDSKLAYAMDLLPGDGAAFVAARAMDGGAEGPDAYLVGLADPLIVEDATDAFSDDDGIYTAAAVSPDGRYGLIADNNLFSSTGNRVGVVDLQAFAPAQVLTSVPDPVDIVVSADSTQVLVVSGFGNNVLTYTLGSGATPLRPGTPISWVGPRPQLPYSAVQVDRGGLRNHVFLAENVGVRTLRFAQGTVVDEGMLDFGNDYISIVGAVGVQP